MRRQIRPGAALRCVLFVLTLAAAASAAEWNPAGWQAQDTLELRTIDPGDAPHWSPVWLVVLDGQLYVRLGSRAAGRIERNQGGMTIGVRIAGQEFDQVKVVPVPAQADAVAAAMAAKYWSDVFVHYFSHPLTARLEPTASGG